MESFWLPAGVGQAQRCTIDPKTGQCIERPSTLTTRSKANSRRTGLIIGGLLLLGAIVAVASGALEGEGFEGFEEFVR